MPAFAVVVDVANVMGARADGWWRDRAGAALRLCRQVTALAGRGVPAGRMPYGLPEPGEWVLVLEGRAKDAAAAASEASMAGEASAADEASAAGEASAASGAAGTPAARVRVVSAPGSGDDAIVGEVGSLNGSCLVVTADRELRRRCEAAGAVVTGPGWLIGLL